MRFYTGWELIRHRLKMRFSARYRAEYDAAADRWARGLFEGMDVGSITTGEIAAGAITWFCMRCEKQGDDCKCEKPIAG